MLPLILFIVAALAILMSGIAPILGGQIVGSDRPKPTGAPEVSTGTGRYGGKCITRESLDLLLAQPVALSCNGVDYVLAAENVNVPEIYIHPEKKLIERQNCDNTTYYSWYCHPPDYGSLWQNTLWKAVPDANKTIADGDNFNIYMKKNPDPNALFICDSPGTGTSEAGDALVTIAADETTAETIKVNNIEALFDRSGNAITIDVEQVPTRRKIGEYTRQTPEGPVDYDVWVNLLRAFSPDEDKALYLVAKGVLSENNNIPALVPYRKYYIGKIFATDPAQDALQLKTFKIIPTPSDPWWNIYLPESKPVLYLYPAKETKINVKVNPVKGSITVSDPLYPEGGWNVIADEKSRIFYQNAVYPYLYFETEVAGYEIPEEGFVLKKNEIGVHLRRIVENLGLAGRETDEFVDYWVDRFKKDVAEDYLFVAIISEEEMNTVVPLQISPVPDTLIRVRLYFKGVKEIYYPKAPEIHEKKSRSGFTVVEWGGILE